MIARSISPLQQFFAWSVILIAGLLAGCHAANDPAAPGEQSAKTAAATTVDDTSDSAIASAQYPQGATVIAAVGDSITYGYGTWKGGYPAKLQDKLLAAGYQAVVINAGISGEASPSTDARFLRAIAGAKIVLLMIGTNDIFSPDECPAGRCRTLEHIASMLDKAIISGMTPVVGTVIREQPYEMYMTWNMEIEALNAEIKRVAAERGVAVVDTFAAVLEHGGQSLYLDHHHLTDDGNDILAQHWFDALLEHKLIQ